ncbi:hypothetical protein Y710_03970 [Gordonia sp. QH-12]|nr:hypothetical protein Y710_03970 [Gordonia sp. QH-12]
MLTRACQAIDDQFHRIQLRCNVIDRLETLKVSAHPLEFRVRRVQFGDESVPFEADLMEFCPGLLV